MNFLAKFVYMPFSLVSNLMKSVVQFFASAFENNSNLQKAIKYLGRFMKKESPNMWIERLSKKALDMSRGDGNLLQLFAKGQISDENALLIEGRTKEYANAILPQGRYPSLYREDIPDELKRSLIIDGRALCGRPPGVAFGPLALNDNDEFISTSFAKARMLAIIQTMISVVIIGVVSAFLGMFLLPKNDNFESSEGARQAVVRLDPLAVALNYRDVFSTKDVDVINEALGSEGKSRQFAASVASTLSVATGYLLYIAIGIIAMGILTYLLYHMFLIARFSEFVAVAVFNAVEPLTKTYPEALVRYRYRFPERKMEQDAYETQIKFVCDIDKSPVIEIGDALGVMGFRGHLLAPMCGAAIKMSILDLLQHLMVTGGTGEGKSRNIYIPIVRQLLSYRKQGYPIAMYCTDDKGAIGADIVRVAKEIGLPESDIITIGTGKDEYFVDLLECLEPFEIADIIKSVTIQMGGGTSSDDFWPDSAADLLAQVAIVLRAAENTKIGVAFSRQNGQRLYSLLSILQVARSDSLILQWCEVVVDAFNDPDEFVAIAEFAVQTNEDGEEPEMNRALKESVEYLVNTWTSKMAEATKSGISASLRKSLKTFAFKPDITEGFGTGYSKRKPQLPAEQLVGNTIKVVNVSHLEHGSAGKLVSICLKTLFYKLARAREQRDPQTAKERINWWFNAQPGGGSEHAINVFLADEFQALVTASQEGLSDSLAWSVLRSAGVAGILISQGSSTYQYAIGKDAFDSMSQNWRSRIYLRSEDSDLAQEAQLLVGKVMRFRSGAWDQLESSVSAEWENGSDVKKIPLATIPDWEDMSATGVHPIFPIELPRYYPIASDEDDGWRPAGEKRPDHRGLLERLTEPSTAVLNRSMAWGKESESAYDTSKLLNSVVEADALQISDIMAMGRGKALVMIQRGGGTIVDICKLR